MPTASTASLLCQTLPPQTKLIGFHGREALSHPYRFVLGLSLSHDVDVDMRAPLGTRGTLHVLRGEQPPIQMHGVVAAFELVQEHDNRSLYLLTLVPQLWELTLTHHSRIFTEGSIPEIIEAVLESSGMSSDDFSLELTGSYETLEHVCQYQEDNLSFISRLMEREGMYYYFEQLDSRERLVITDDKASHASLGGGVVRYGSWNDGEALDRGTVDSFRCRMSVLPSKVQLTDYDYLKPDLDVSGVAPIDETSRGHIVMYGRNFRTPTEGARRARIRAEEYRARQAVYEARGTTWGMRPGYRFQLENHPRASLNNSYLTVAAEHFGRQAHGVDVIDSLLGLPENTTYAVELTAIEADVQFRAERVTPWPRIDGVVDGVIDGSADSPYAQIDEHGRYKVRVFFDESDLLDGSASTWVRMLQPHGGGTEGMHFPLRKGTEVHMVFLGGDPDRPVIVGVAPNAKKPSKVTAGNFTHNVIMTGGSNRLELEDQDGGQYVTMSTPTLGSYLHIGAGAYNFVSHTLGNNQEFVGGNKDGEIVGNMTERVTGSVSEDYQATKNTNIVGALSESFASTHTRNVDGPVTFTLNSTLTETVQGAVTRTLCSTFSETISGAVTTHYKATLDETVDGDVTTTTANVSEVHNGNKSTTITGTHSVDAAGAQHLNSYASQLLTAPTQTFTADGAQSLASDTFAVEASSSASVNAPTVTINADGSVTISSATITIEGGDVTMTGGNLSVTHGAIAINGSPITVNGGGGIDMTAGLIKLNS